MDDCESVEHDAVNLEPLVLDVGNPKYKRFAFAALNSGDPTWPTAGF